MSDKLPETKHTPGPWRANFGGPAPSVECDGRCPVVNWQGFDDSDRPIAEHQSNARLVAAAPELLGLLKELVAWNDDKNGDGVGLEKICRRAKKLVSAAEGSVPRAH